MEIQFVSETTSLKEKRHIVEVWMLVKRFEEERVQLIQEMKTAIKFFQAQLKTISKWVEKCLQRMEDNHYPPLPCKYNN
jgi:hypothetical protein